MDKHAEISENLVPLNLLVNPYVGSAIMLSIKDKNPVILNLTNLVVQTQTANVLLALGASPIMSHEIDEIDEIVAFSDSVNMNIGTLTHTQIALFHQAAKAANQASVPIVLDPVGAGATKLRTQTSLDLLQDYEIAILRGNPSEIIALEGTSQKTNTIDSKIETHRAIDAAKRLSTQYQTTVVISGQIDYCVKDEKYHAISGGAPIMSQVTGMGCIASSVCAATASLSLNPIDAGIIAMKLMGEVGERAANIAKGCGSFLNCFIDELYNLNAPSEI